MKEFVAVDLEMTGLRVKTDRILEIGAVKVSGETVTETFQTFVNPHRRLDPSIRKLTGITDEMVADAPEAADAVGRFLRFADGLALVGHNIRYDYGFLKQCAVNHNLIFDAKTIDTLKIGRKLLSEPEKKTLDSLCAYFGIAREGAHRALNDAEATARLFLILRKRYAGQEPQLFEPSPMQYHLKKQGPLTPAQKRDLNHLLICHKIKLDMETDSLTRSEASRMIDLLRQGRRPDGAADEEGSDDV